VTDQPPSQQPAGEPEGDEPAALVPDDAPTNVSAPTPTPAPAPPAAFAAPDAPAPPPPASTSPVTELPSGEDTSAGPGGLAAAFPPDRPERAVGAAFGGGLLLAVILRRLAR
jgi:hypothetical protein